MSKQKKARSCRTPKYAQLYAPWLSSVLIFALYQFRESMLIDWQNIRVKPGVEVVRTFQTSGFGQKVGYVSIA